MPKVKDKKAIVGNSFEIVEAYKALRANLLFSLASSQKKIVLVSSSQITAIPKASTTARIGKSILLLMLTGAASSVTSSVVISFVRGFVVSLIILSEFAESLTVVVSSLITT